MTYYHRVSIPAEDHPQQELISIDYEYHEILKRKPHKNGVDEYIELLLNVQPGETIERVITYRLMLRSYILQPQHNEMAKMSKSDRRFLGPSRLVESDAPAIIEIAERFAEGELWERVTQAHVFPGLHLHYSNMIRSEGALFALENRYGDCTEYATLFVAIVRAMGIPARYTMELNLQEKKKQSFSIPNHHAAEVWIHGRWVPADPNLATDSTLGYGFGYGATGKIILNREGAWTWGDWYPGSSEKPVVQRQWIVTTHDELIN